MDIKCCAATMDPAAVSEPHLLITVNSVHLCPWYSHSFCY